MCKCKAKLRRRDGDVKLVEHVAGSGDGVLELSGGLRWVRCSVFVHSSISAKMSTRTVTASAFGWNGDGFTEHRPLPNAFVSRDRVDKARRCDRGPHVYEQICFHITFVDGWKTILKSGTRSSGALVVAPRRSTDNSRTLLLPCRKVVVDPCGFSHGSPEGGSGTGKAAWAEKTVSKGSFDTARATSKFPEQAT